jgi:CAAX prenyl protease-like protein
VGTLRAAQEFCQDGASLGVRCPIFPSDPQHSTHTLTSHQSPSLAASLPYIAPFGVFVCLLTVVQFLHLPEAVVQVILIALPAAVLVAATSLPARSNSPIDFTVRRRGGSVLLGALVFLVWIGPGLMFPTYREHWLFTNSITGSTHSGLSTASRHDPVVLILRTVRAVAIVPVVEELFWRAWLMRFLVRADFLSVPLGAWSPRAFWIVAVLFASEHGPYWDVGLAAGILYNWWMLRSRSLGDLVLAHAVTNLCLSAYVVAAGRWEYW